MLLEQCGEYSGGISRASGRLFICLTCAVSSDNLGYYLFFFFFCEKWKRVIQKIKLFFANKRGKESFIGIWSEETIDNRLFEFNEMRIIWAYFHRGM